MQHLKEGNSKFDKKKTDGHNFTTEEENDAVRSSEPIDSETQAQEELLIKSAQNFQRTILPCYVVLPEQPNLDQKMVQVKNQQNGEEFTITVKQLKDESVVY